MRSTRLVSPKGACGDVVRNVTGCPLAGVAHDELDRCLADRA